MSITELTNDVLQCIESLSSCRKTKTPPHLSKGDQIAHMIFSCEINCDSYFSCKKISHANDILIYLDEEDEN